jgi:hypothetical protein
MNTVVPMDRGVVSMVVPNTGQVASTACVSLQTVPRCTVNVDKCKDGLKLVCECSDEGSTRVLQNLCAVLGGGLVSCCLVQNGAVVQVCNFTVGLCQCEVTKNGVSITCTSADPRCCKIIQECCNCVKSLLECGCYCCVCVNNTPVCCGGCER